MNVYVFTGPTLSAADARQTLDAIYLPPAAQGDVYRAARERPAAIGIVDGYFDTLPAIWHKEILWAIHEGVPVFGSASMGALRGAELAVFGMRGVGTVFEAFRRGELDDDDEVALAHEPEAAGYRALSVPMVNIRATLAAATLAGVITPEARDLLLERGKALFYPERSYRRLVAEGNAAGLRAQMDALAAWLPAGQVDAKRVDALAMLDAMKGHLASPPDKAPARFHFEHTTFWDGLRQSCDETAAPATEAPAAASQWRDVVDEARLERGTYERLRLTAINRALGRALGEREGRRIPRERLSRAVEDFRRARALRGAGSLERWLAEHDLDGETLGRLLEDEALTRWSSSASDIERRVLDEMKLTDAYPDLRARALDKERVLGAAGLSEPGPADAGMTREQLIDWYFRAVRSQPPPEDVSHYVRDAGLTDEQFFLRIALREFLYRKLISERETTKEDDDG